MNVDKYRPAASAEAQWGELDGSRQDRLLRAQELARLTAPEVFPVFGRTNTSSSQLDYQSIGAIATTNLTSKLTTALFRPTVPFFRILPGDKLTNDMQKNGQVSESLNPVLAIMERNAAKMLDVYGQRPKLYSLIKHLIVTGNVLAHFGKDSIRVIGMRNYVVKRDYLGRPHTVIVRERILPSELSTDLQEYCQQDLNGLSKVDWFTRIWREPNGSYASDQWLGGKLLPDEFNSHWSEATCPWRPQVWSLADEDDWGTGLAEEYLAALSACSILARATTIGAVLGAEFRILVAGNSATNLQAISTSQNGDVLPGTSKDISILSGGNAESLKTAMVLLDKYEQQVSRGFLLHSGTVRDAERVTAREIDMDNQELSARFGGLYPTLGATLQPPVAHWCLNQANTPIGKVDLKLQVLSGLDALSRNQDLANLRGALQDMATIGQLPPELQARLKMDDVSAAIGNGWGVDFTPYLHTQAEFQQMQEQQQQARVDEQNATNPQMQPQGTSQ